MTLLSVYIEYYNYELQKGIGLIAINDSFWIESTIYKILKKYFRNDPYYINVVELFHEVCDLKSHFCAMVFCAWACILLFISVFIEFYPKYDILWLLCTHLPEYFDTITIVSCSFEGI